MSTLPAPATLAAQEQGRNQLAAWKQAVPDNFFTTDSNLQRVLQMYLGEATYQTVAGRLSEFGFQVATIIDEAATINDRPENHPRLNRWDGIGQRTEEVEFHPSYHIAGRPVYESGILTLQEHPGNAVLQSAYFYLLSQAGEMGHVCPIVCTMGLIRTLQTVGSENLQQHYLPSLLESDYDRKQVASQYLTEVQGGSDVGANAVVAENAGDGSWRLTGEKWFCSVANADQMLVTARPLHAPAGTRGLGVFLVPRRLPDGSLNRIYLRRLKTKFGTRTMATAEIDFDHAVAYPLGNLEDGIHIVTELVLNTSRWANALGSAGLLRRAYVEAWTFAQHREAFGHAIADYPLVAEALAEIKVDTAAILASTMHLSHLIDRIDMGLATAEERGVHRLLVNINKYFTSVQASLSIRRAQEVLGGNGAIEDFSILPRLYRDALVFESWEGSHNVLCLQALRDMQKYRLHEQLFSHLEQMLTEITAHDLYDLRLTITRMLDETRQRVDTLLTADPGFQQSHIRRLVDQLTAVTQAVCLLSEAARELTQAQTSAKADWLEFFLNRYLRPNYDPMQDPDYTTRIQRITAEL